jgi:hypothetical protein
LLQARPPNVHYVPFFPTTHYSSHTHIPANHNKDLAADIAVSYVVRSESKASDDSPCGELVMFVVFADNIEPTFLTKNKKKRKQYIRHTMLLND